MCWDYKIDDINLYLFQIKIYFELIGVHLCFMEIYRFLIITLFCVYLETGVRYYKSKVSNNPARKGIHSKLRISE